MNTQNTLHDIEGSRVEAMVKPSAATPSQCCSGFFTWSLTRNSGYGFSRDSVLERSQFHASSNGIAMFCKCHGARWAASWLRRMESSLKHSPFIFYASFNRDQSGEIASEKAWNSCLSCLDWIHEIRLGHCISQHIPSNPNVKKNAGENLLATFVASFWFVFHGRVTVFPVFDTLYPNHVAIIAPKGQPKRLTSSCIFDTWQTIFETQWDVLLLKVVHLSVGWILVTWWGAGWIWVKWLSSRM